MRPRVHGAAGPGKPVPHQEGEPTEQQRTLRQPLDHRIQPVGFVVTTRVGGVPLILPVGNRLVALLDHTDVRVRPGCYAGRVERAGRDLAWRAAGGSPGDVPGRGSVSRVEEARRAAFRHRLALGAGLHTGHRVAPFLEDVGDGGGVGFVARLVHGLLGVLVGVEGLRVVRPGLLAQFEADHVQVEIAQLVAETRDVGIQGSTCRVPEGGFAVSHRSRAELLRLLTPVQRARTPESQEDHPGHNHHDHQATKAHGKSLLESALYPQVTSHHQNGGRAVPAGFPWWDEGSGWHRGNLDTGQELGRTDPG